MAEKCHCNDTDAFQLEEQKLTTNTVLISCAYNCDNMKKPLFFLFAGYQETSETVECILPFEIFYFNNDVIVVVCCRRCPFVQANLCKWVQRSYKYMKNFR